MLKWCMTSAVLSIVMMLTTTCRLQSAAAAAALELKDLVPKVIVRRSVDDVGLLPFGEQRNRDSPAIAKLLDRNRSFLGELFESERRASHLQPSAQYVYVDPESLFRGGSGEEGARNGGSERGGIGRGTSDVRRSKRHRWQGFCFAKTRSGRFLPYICWKGEVKRPATNRSQRFGRRW